MGLKSAFGIDIEQASLERATEALKDLKLCWVHSCLCAAVANIVDRNELKKTVHKIAKLSENHGVPKSSWHAALFKRYGEAVLLR